MAKKEKKEPTTGVAKLMEWIRAIVWTVGIWLFLSTFVVQAYFIPSPSMETTLMVGDVLFVNKMIFGAKIPFIGAHMPKVRDPRQGDIVVFISPIEDSILVKRLIGVPGDTIQMKAGRLYRNSVEQLEPYTQSTAPDIGVDMVFRRDTMRVMQLPHYIGADPEKYLPDVHEWGPLVVPKDSLWMMGDNRDSSRDSRFWGFVPRRNVRGKPLVIYYSWDGTSYRPFPFLTATRWGRILTFPK